jgi:hypothetical protein
MSVSLSPTMSSSPRLLTVGPTARPSSVAPILVPVTQLPSMPNMQRTRHLMIHCGAFRPATRAQGHDLR